MRYINNYNYNTLIIIDSKNNETVGKVLLDIEDIPLENNLNTDRIEKGKGYCFRKDRNKWMAYIKKDNKMKTIGYFNTEEEAKQARSLYCENQ